VQPTHDRHDRALRLVVDPVIEGVVVPPGLSGLARPEARVHRRPAIADRVYAGAAPLALFCRHDRVTECKRGPKI